MAPPTRSRSVRSALIFGAVLGLSACADRGAPEAPGPRGTVSSEAHERPTVPTAADDAEAAALARANAAADRLATTLRGRLMAAMQAGGPASAVDVCSTEAPAIAREAAEATGARVGRSSLRLRNPRNAAPPPWVAAWLESTGEGPASAAEGFARVEDGHARVLRPIAVEGPCVACHGESVSPEVAAVLRERYPDDRATGYSVGDLRGALWAEAEVARPAE